MVKVLFRYFLELDLDILKLNLTSILLFVFWQILARTSTTVLICTFSAAASSSWPASFARAPRGRTTTTGTRTGSSSTTRRSSTLRTFRGDSKFEYFFFFGEIVQLFQFIIVFFVFLYTTYCTEFKNI